MEVLNAGWIGNVCDVLMVLIWAVYLQLFFRSLRRGNRPTMFIHHAQGNDPLAPCLFVNMSKDPVHIQCAIAYIKTKQGTATRYLTDNAWVRDDDRRFNPESREGPIEPGGYLELGSFADILLGRKSGDTPHAVAQQLHDYQQLQLCVAVNHGPSEHHVGVRRTFAIEQARGEVVVRAYSI